MLVLLMSVTNLPYITSKLIENDCGSHTDEDIERIIAVAEKAFAAVAAMEK